MPRPRKCRKVCCLPSAMEFAPVDAKAEAEAVVMAVDEYEAIRLIDNEGFSQERCGEYMGIARTTVQQIYDCARKKLARALVEGRPLKISGGEFRLCDGAEAYCGCGGCARHRFARMRMDQEEGANKMIVAIPVDDTRENICVSFGRAPYFLFCGEDGSSRIGQNPAAQAEGGAGIQAAQFVADQGAQALITVRCGENAAEVLKAAGIAIYQADGLSAAHNAAALAEGRLPLLTRFHAGFHGRQ